MASANQFADHHDVSGDVVGDGGLLFGRGGHRISAFHQALDQILDAQERIGHVVRDFLYPPDLRNDFFGGMMGLTCEFLYLVCHNGEAASRVTGARRLDGPVGPKL